MIDLITVPNILFIVTMFGVFANVLLNIRKPQEEGKLTDAVFNTKMQFMRDEIKNMKDNHIHTLDEKLDGVCKEVTENRLAISRLGTIIEERIPKK